MTENEAALDDPSESFSGEAELRAALPARYHHLLDADYKPGRNATDEEAAFAKIIADRRALAAESAKIAEQAKAVKRSIDSARRAQHTAVKALLRREYEALGEEAMQLGLTSGRLEAIRALGLHGDAIVDRLTAGGQGHPAAALGVAAATAGFDESAVAAITAAGLRGPDVVELLVRLRERRIDVRSLLAAPAATPA
ncbi:hypothetical protein FHW79_006074 [Azospirillum sp. OGB3]|uniref:hypothetical protein n=1 Tax=Azospirillum sp. OGB3 TaxID=2587012 RepID=UPI00160588B8|nr:hypothetical protein [Azospirillum sp. OGB3]MBB3268399.1 hypothetical protein [Azospirillum sp. OGB3]